MTETEITRLAVTSFLPISPLSTAPSSSGAGRVGPTDLCKNTGVGRPFAYREWASTHLASQATVVMLSHVCLSEEDLFDLDDVGQDSGLSGGSWFSTRSSFIKQKQEA